MGMIRFYAPAGCTLRSTVQEMHSYVQDGLLTDMSARRVGTRVAQPDVKALVVGSKCLGASDAIGHPSHGSVKQAMHEDDHVPCTCSSPACSHADMWL